MFLTPFSVKTPILLSARLWNTLSLPALRTDSPQQFSETPNMPKSTPAFLRMLTVAWATLLTFVSYAGTQQGKYSSSVPGTNGFTSRPFAQSALLSRSSPIGLPTPAMFFTVRRSESGTPPTPSSTIVRRRALIISTIPTPRGHRSTQAPQVAQRHMSSFSKSTIPSLDSAISLYTRKSLTLFQGHKSVHRPH